MRITGGEYTNRKVVCPKGEIRPAMDRMRESMFAALGDIAGTSFLDLFSGSGVVGIEAASRGAEPVYLVEGDYRKRRTIESNISFVKREIQVKTMPVERFLQRADRSFDLIFLDPPFPYRNKEKLIELVCKSGALEKNGILLIHHPKEEHFADKIASLTLFNTKSYGRSILRFYRPFP